MGAALNALTARHMMNRLNDDQIYSLLDEMYHFFRDGGMSETSARDTVKSITPNPAKFCTVVSMILLQNNVPPCFDKCFAGGRWNYISNPLIALHGDEDEIRLARIDIFKRYQIDVNFDM